MVEGPSGLLAVARADEEMVWWPTRGVVTLRVGGGGVRLFGGGAGELARAASIISPGATSWPNGRARTGRAGRRRPGTI